MKAVIDYLEEENNTTKHVQHTNAPDEMWQVLKDAFEFFFKGKVLC